MNIMFVWKYIMNKTLFKAEDFLTIMDKKNNQQMNIFSQEDFLKSNFDVFEESIAVLLEINYPGGKKKEIKISVVLDLASGNLIKIGNEVLSAKDCAFLAKEYYNIVNQFVIDKKLNDEDKYQNDAKKVSTVIKITGDSDNHYNEIKINVNINEFDGNSISIGKTEFEPLDFAFLAINYNDIVNKYDSILV